MNNAQIKRVVDAIYQSRKIRLTNPEGEFIGKSWFPHAREQGEDSMGSVKEPTENGRYSYQIHCRSKAHVRHQVARALAGHEVPQDVADTLARANVVASVKPSTKVIGITQRDLPEPMAQFAQFLAMQEKKKVDGRTRH